MSLGHWLDHRFWHVPRWAWLLGVLLVGAVGWWQFVVPKPAPLAAPVAALPLALEGTPIPQPRAPITPANAAQIAQLMQFGEDTPRLFAASPNGRWLATGSSSNMAIYATQTLSQTESLNTPFHFGVYQYSNLAVASDGATVAAIDGFELWLRPAGGAARLITHNGNGDNRFTALVFAPDSTTLAASDGVSIQLFRVSDGALLRSYRKNYGSEQVLAFSPDGTWLLTYSGERVLLREIGGWWMWPRTEVTSLDADVAAAAFSHDGALLALGTADGHVTTRSFAQGTLGGERTVIDSLPPITSVAFAPDDHSLAVGALGDVVRLVNIPTSAGETARPVLLAHTRSVSATLLAGFAPDGTLATAAFESRGAAPSTTSQRATLRHWRASDGVQLGEHVWGVQPQPRIRFTSTEAPSPFKLDDQTTRPLPDAGEAAYLALEAGVPRLWRLADSTLPPLAAPGEHWIAGRRSAAGTTLAVLAANTTDVYLVGVADGALLHIIGSGLPVDHIVWMSDSTTVVLGDRYSTTFWSTDGKPIRTLAGEYAALSPDGALLATKQGNHLQIWQAADGTLRYTIAVSAEWIPAVAFSPDGATLAVGDRNGVASLFAAANGTALRRLPKQAENLRTVTFTPDSTTLVCLASDGIVRLWQVADGTLLHVLNTPAISIDTMQIAPNGAIIATASYTDSVRLWRVADGTLLQTIADQRVGLAFSADSTRLLTNGNLVREWLVASGAKLGERIGPQAWWHSTPSLDGTLRLTAGVGVWRVANGAVVGSFPDSFDQGVFAPDGQTLLTTEPGGVVKLRRSSNGALLHTLQMPNYTGRSDAAVFAPNSTTVAVGTREGDVPIWRVADGALLRTLSIPKEAGNFFRDIQSLAYSPDGRLLAAGSSNGSIWLLHADDGTLLVTLRGHGGLVGTLAFSPDAALLGSAARDGTARLWGVP